MRALSPDPTDRLGVYKRLADVPDLHRLRRFADEYEGRDVWREYVTATDRFERNDGDRYEQDTTRAADHWRTHAAEHGRHPALATPAIVDAWCRTLLEDRCATTVYNQYWTRIAPLYAWLRWNAEHPHLYDPFLMAATEFRSGAAGAVWDGKIDRRHHE